MNTKILDVDVQIGGVTYDNTLSEDLRIDKTNLDEEFATQAERFAYYAAMAELAKYRHQLLKNELEVLYASLDAEKRSNALNAMTQNPKLKYTETMYENEVKGDVRYQAKMREYLDMGRLAGILSVGREAFSQRREMLISLGANHRIGGGVDTRILAAQAKQQVADRRQHNFSTFSDTSDDGPESDTSSVTGGNAAPRRRAAKTE